MASVAERFRPLPSVRSLPSSFVLPAAVLFVLLAVSLYLRTDSLGESLWMDEGLSIGIASQPLFDIPGRAARGRLAAASTTCCSRSGWTWSATGRGRRRRCRC